jgi:hypothetical protein
LFSFEKGDVALLVPKTTINLLDIPFFKNVLAHNQITSPMGRPMISLPNNHWLGFDLLNIESCNEFLEIMIAKGVNAFEYDDAKPAVTNIYRYIHEQMDAIKRVLNY